MKLTPRGEWVADILALAAIPAAIASVAIIHHLIGA